METDGAGGNDSIKYLVISLLVEKFGCHYSDIQKSELRIGVAQCGALPTVGRKQNEAAYFHGRTVE